MAVHDDVQAPQASAPTPELARLEVRVALEEWLALTQESGLAGEVTYQAWHQLGPRSLPVWIRPAD